MGKNRTRKRERARANNCQRCKTKHALTCPRAPSQTELLLLHTHAGADTAAPEGYAGAEDLSEAEAFLRSHGAVLVPAARGADGAEAAGGAGLMLDTKATRQQLQTSGR